MFLKHRSKSKLPTIIGEETQFTGDIISSGEVQIDGEVIGDIHAVLLKIHSDASVKGNIVAEQIEHHGKITGSVQTSHIYMAKGSHIEGDVLHQNITIEAGAFINGACQHIVPEEEAEAEAEKDNVFALPSKSS
jgi:cytoskeletal protein CcmA (bactofilin family)